MFPLTFRRVFPLLPKVKDARLQASSRVAIWLSDPLVRAVVFWVGAAALLLITADPSLRIAALRLHLISATIFTLAMLVIVPARIWPAAVVAAGLLLAAVEAAFALKGHITGFPITYLDLATAWAQPNVLARALGYRGPLIVLGLVLLLPLIAGIALLLRFFGKPLAVRLAVGAIEIAALFLIIPSVLNAVASDMRFRLAELSPGVAVDFWEASGQILLERHTGPLEYLAYTYHAGDKDLIGDVDAAPPPLPRQAIRSVAARYLRFPAPTESSLPNIVIVHAESTFDPNLIFALNKPIELPLWHEQAETQSLGPLAVHIVGGGSQVTEFEVLTGVDAREFGYQGFYSHRTIGPRARRAFPAYLAARGYEGSAYTIDTASYFGVADAFRHYGFQRFFDRNSLGLRSDWLENDRHVVETAIANGAFTTSARPRLVFITTIENHGPHRCVHFRSSSQLGARFAAKADFLQECSLNEYILRAQSTSSALLAVLAQLKRLESVTGRPYVLLAYGDHQPWSFTEGDYSVAGGTVNEGDTSSFARFRRNDNRKITLYHLFSSVRGVVPRSFDKPIPPTLLPTLLSAYVAAEPDDLYLPVNLLAFERCGSDFEAPKCNMRAPMQEWTKRFLLGRPSQMTPRA